MNNVLVVTGSDGATAKGIIYYFADKYVNVIGNYITALRDLIIIIV